MNEQPIRQASIFSLLVVILMVTMILIQQNYKATAFFNHIEAKKHFWSDIQYTK